MEVVLFAIVIILVLLLNFRVKNSLNPLFAAQAVPGISTSELEVFYQKYSYYYVGLPENEKTRFIKRAHKLSQEIFFEGRRGLKVSNEIRMFVIAAFIQITFGLNNFLLPKFRRVIVYPDSYYNQITGRMHKGEVNPRGAIVLSLKSLLRGYAVPNDSINLGIHELAHALFYSLTNAKSMPPELEEKTKQFTFMALAEIERITTSQNHIFRKYAATNVSELFAVATEHFFEAPNELKETIPQLYNSLSKLLNQDPASKVFTIKPLHD